MFHVTAGFSYGRGRRSVEQPVNLSDVAAAEREATYRSYKIILGFEFAL